MHLAYIEVSVLKEQKESWTSWMVTDLTPQAWLSTHVSSPIYKPSHYMALQRLEGRTFFHPDMTSKSHEMGNGSVNKIL